MANRFVEFDEVIIDSQDRKIIENGIERDMTQEEDALFPRYENILAREQELQSIPRVEDHRAALRSARDKLLAYNFGVPNTPTFPEVLAPVQQAVLEYRDCGIKDPVCDDHIMWINTRVNEINAAALHALGVLQ